MTTKIMRDPVVTHDGQVYERAAGMSVLLTRSHQAMHMKHGMQRKINLQHGMPTIETTLVARVCARPEFTSKLQLFDRAGSKPSGQ